MKQAQIDHRLDELMAAFSSFRSWGKAKMAAKNELLSFMKSCGYKFFPSTYRGCFGLRCVGDQIVLDLPLNRKGYLSPFKGQRVRILCVGSGRHSDRDYAAGVTSKPITHNYTDVVKFWIKEEEAVPVMQETHAKPVRNSIRRGRVTINELSTEEAIAKYGTSLIFVGGVQKTSPQQKSILDLIRRVGDEATEQVRKEMKAKTTSSLQKRNTDTLTHEEQMEQVAQSVLRDGLASSIEEARKMVDEAI